MTYTVLRHVHIALGDVLNVCLKRRASMMICLKQKVVCLVGGRRRARVTVWILDELRVGFPTCVGAEDMMVDRVGPAAGGLSYSS